MTAPSTTSTDVPANHGSVFRNPSTSHGCPCTAHNAKPVRPTCKAT